VPRLAGALVAAAGLAVAAILACPACSGDEPASIGGDEDAASPGTDAAREDDARPEATIVVELGTGSASFVPLKDGDEVAMVRGKQGFQHVWISARVLRPTVRDAVVTLSTRLRDGRPGGPRLSTAVTFDPVDGGGGASEKVGLTGLVDYAVIGKLVDVHLEVTTADGRWGADDRSIDVLAPVEHRCTAEAGTTTCDVMCGASRCSTCETGSTDVGYVDRADGSALVVASCTSTVGVDELQIFACCCCR
jgi:hypothetical protein